MKNQKRSSQSAPTVFKNQRNQYPETEERHNAGFEDFKPTYENANMTEKEEFRNSLPFALIGCAKGH
ncbi:hypothetical protein [Dyadobacter sp. 676]|uniref:Uncharacterized protein n=1 Tax=Dyadobacter sp. 676 TaxID=3088362 RepID=A0AAU8FL69_9BACT